MKSRAWLSKGGKREENKRLMIFPAVSTNAYPPHYKAPTIQKSGYDFSLPTFPCQNTHYTWPNTGCICRVLTTESGQHTEVLSCNEKVQRVSRLGSFWSGGNCSKSSLCNMWATKSELEDEGVSLFLFLPPSLFLNVGAGKGWDPEIDQVMVATPR